MEEESSFTQGEGEGCNKRRQWDEETTRNKETPHSNMSKEKTDAADQSYLLPLSVLLHHVGPFLDRVTWNKLILASKELLRESSNAGIIPTWPKTRRLPTRYQTGEIAATAALPPVSISFSHDTVWLALAYVHGRVNFWNVISGPAVGSTDFCSSPEQQGQRLAHVQFGPDYLLTATGNQLDFWSLPSLQDGRVSEFTKRHDSISIHSNYISSVALSSDGSFVVTGHLTSHSEYSLGMAALWDVESGLVVNTFRQELIGTSYPIPHVFCIDICPFAPYSMLLGCSDSTIRVWNHTHPDEATDNQQEEESCVWTAHEMMVKGVAWSPTQPNLAASGSLGLLHRAEEGTARLWEIGNDKDSTSIPTLLAKTTPIGTENLNVTVVAFSPNGKSIAIGGANGFVGLWDISKPATELRQLAGAYGEQPVAALDFAPDGCFLAVSSRGGRVSLFQRQW